MREVKKNIRKNILQAKEALSHEIIEEKSQAIFDTLREKDYYKNAENVMIYITLGKEVITPTIIDDLMNKGKRVFVPLTVPKTKELIVSELKNFDEDLEVGHFGVLEPKKEATRPVDPSILDLVVVPGVAFDRRGFRVGYGAGYYDRFLTRLSEKATTIALAFDMQLIDEVPIEHFDMSVQYIITETQLLDIVKDKA